jgi:hypothetical protein
MFLCYYLINTLRTRFLLNNAKNVVRTSQKTHYVSVTKTNQLTPFREKSLFIVRTIRNTQISFVARIQSFRILKRVVYIVTNMTVARQWFIEHRLKAGIGTNRSGSPFARQRFSKHISEVTQSTVGGHPLLSSSLLGTFHSNGQNINNNIIITNCSRWWFLFRSPEVIKGGHVRMLNRIH